MHDNKPYIPAYRFPLKAKITLSGYRTLTDFAKAVGISGGLLSNIVCGWRVPGPETQRKMASTLGITLKEFRNLL